MSDTKDKEEDAERMLAAIEEALDTRVAQKFLSGVRGFTTPTNNNKNPLARRNPEHP